jgi:CRP/FNR family transcriptional regulator, cyclic AMP receptor protein
MMVVQHGSEMTMDDPVALLRSVTLFAAVNEQTLTRLARRLQRRAYRRNEVIMHRGDPAGALHVIRSGRVKVTLPSEDGDETVLALMTAGDCFGEIAALDGGPRSATVTAVEQTETLALLRDDLLASVRAEPDLALALIETLAARIRRTDAWLEDAYFQDLDTRLARRLVELADEQGRTTPDGIEVAFPLTQSDLAGMLGVTRVSVNRLLGAYQDDHLLRLGRGSFTVLNPDALRRRAGR